MEKQHDFDFISIKEAAEILKCSGTTIWRLIKRGQLESSNAMKHHRIPRRSFNLFLEKSIKKESINNDYKRAA